MRAPLRVGWFSTGRGPGSRALLTAAMDAIRRADLNAELAFVFCNRERGQDPNTDQFLDLAAGYGLDVLTLSDRDFRRRAGGEIARAGQPLPAWRADFDRAMLKRIAPYTFDVGMLAGYMLILAPDTTTVYPFLNLHPAAPGGPKGTWQRVIWELIREQAAESGVYLHVATPELDEGPVATFCRYPLRGPHLDGLWAATAGRTVAQLQAEAAEEHPLFREIRRQGAARELPLIIETLSALAAGRFRVAPGRVTDAAGRPFLGLDLSAEVEAQASLHAPPG
jgi:folate-dependent phosphoribosylglycinamide formyltransferase PurN